MDFHTLGSDVFNDSLDYVINVLDSLLATEIVELRNRVLYTLGFIHYFDRADTLRARVYLEELLESAPTSEFAVFTKRFFDNNQFVKLGRLPSIVEYEMERAAAEAEVEVETDIEIDIEIDIEAEEDSMDEYEEIEQLPHIDSEDHLDYHDDD
jgi:hypothetical protein